MLSFICSRVTVLKSSFFLRFFGLWASGLGCLLLIIFLIVLDPFLFSVIKSSVVLCVNFFCGSLSFTMPSNFLLCPTCCVICAFKFEYYRGIIVVPVRSSSCAGDLYWRFW